MRLLHARTEELREFADGEVPEYAILSHTWGADEVRLRDLNPGYCPWHAPATSDDDDEAARRAQFRARYRARPAYAVKVRGCCRRALEDGIDWVWVDTCCIDSASSSELQEAINSMYAWYEGARVCYAYLADVGPGERGAEGAGAPDSAFRRSRWFTRGWTLQELLAPRSVLFFDREWGAIGAREELAAAIEACTGVAARYLTPTGRIFIRLASVAEKMSWAARRQTTRREDVAYCLLGLFGVNMPMLYGEGARAFARLQEEIMRRSRDQSLIASGYRLPRPTLEESCAGVSRWTVRAALAGSPASFLLAADAKPRAPERPTDSFVIGQRGLAAHLPVYRCARGWEYCVLNCGISTGAYKQDYRLIAIPLVPIRPQRQRQQQQQQQNTYSSNDDGSHDNNNSGGGGDDLDTDYWRMEMQIPIFAPLETLLQSPSQTFFVRRAHATPNRRPDLTRSALALGRVALPPDFYLAGVWPPQSHPFTALELAYDDDDDDDDDGNDNDVPATESASDGKGARKTTRRASRAMLHIARREARRRGVLVMVASDGGGEGSEGEAEGDERALHRGGALSLLGPAQRPRVAAVHVAADFCAVDAAAQAARMAGGARTLTERQPIELIPVPLGASPGAAAASPPSGVIMVEHVRRGGKAFLDIDLVDHAGERGEGRGEGEGKGKGPAEGPKTCDADTGPVELRELYEKLASELF